MKNFIELSGKEIATISGGVNIAVATATTAFDLPRRLAEVTLYAMIAALPQSIYTFQYCTYDSDVYGMYQGKLVAIFGHCLKKSAYAHLGFIKDFFEGFTS